MEKALGGPRQARGTTCRIALLRASLAVAISLFAAAHTFLHQRVTAGRAADVVDAPPAPPHGHGNGTAANGTAANGTAAPPLATAVLVEMRCHPSFSVALHGAVENLGPEVVLVVVHSSRNARFVRGVLESVPALAGAFDDGRIALRETRESDWGDPCPRRSDGGCGVYAGNFWYSRMFVSPAFWEGFETPYVLTLQSDTLLCRPFPTGELVSRGVSFTGGVSGMKAGFKKYRTTEDPRHGAVLDGGEYLNGGMSFRDVRWVRDCIRTHAPARPGGWIEDDLYRHCRENNINGTVHETEMGAYAWSSDNGVTLCFRDPSSGNRTCPLGVHKPWTHGSKKPQLYDELKRNCPGLHVLHTLSRKGLHRGENCTAHDLEGSETNFKCNCT